MPTAGEAHYMLEQQRRNPLPPSKGFGCLGLVVVLLGVFWLARGAGGPSSTGPEVPSEYVGTWAGTVVDDLDGKKLAVTVEVAQGRGENSVGTVKVKKPGCQAELVPTRQSGGPLMVQTDPAAPGPCANRTLRLNVDDGKLRFSGPGNNGSFWQGTLTRQTR